MEKKAKLWRDMTPAEKGALLLAHHEGKVIEAWGEASSVWYSDEYPDWEFGLAYRVKPEPTVETVIVRGWHYIGQAQGCQHAERSHRITFNLIDGKPDCTSIRMEEL